MVPLMVLHLKKGPYINRKNNEHPHRLSGSYIYVYFEQGTSNVCSLHYGFNDISPGCCGRRCSLRADLFEVWIWETNIRKVIRMEFAFERQLEEYRELKNRILDILQQVKDDRKDLEHEKENMQVGTFLNSKLRICWRIATLNLYFVWFVYILPR